MARKPNQNKANRPRPRSAARPLAAKQAVRRTRAAAETPYHHGALRDALLQAAEKVLERDGLPGLTLRAVAREAGVSHAAPTHHFGDLTGLVSELAAIGYRQFSAAMTAGKASGTLQEQGLAAARAYVAFAQAHPGMYGLMFRAERLDMSRPSLHDASDAAFAGLARGVGASRHEHIAADSRETDFARKGSAHHVCLAADKPPFAETIDYSRPSSARQTTFANPAAADAEHTSGSRA